MGKRSTSRRLAMQILYQADISSESIKAIAKNILDEDNLIEETKKFALHLASNAWEHKKEIDGAITEKSQNWPLPRMGIVDRNILRLAIYELKYEKDTPAKVVIDEAIELAKKYSTNQAAKFINGILGKLI